MGIDYVCLARGDCADMDAPTGPFATRALFVGQSSDTREKQPLAGERGLRVPRTAV